MAYLPHEILTEVARELESIYDLRAFRLVCRAWAAVGYPILAHHMTVLNTKPTLKQFTEFLQQSPHNAFYTKSLTICHVEWPVCPRTEWETHPLLFDGKKTWVECAPCLDLSMDKAYTDYEDFVSTELARIPSTDSAVAYELLNSLPSLTTLLIKPLNAWSLHRQHQMHHLTFTKRVWMWPSRGRIQNIVRWILPVVNNFCHIARLEIGGVFHPYIPSSKLDHILHLRIDFLELKNGSERDYVGFLMAFPNLQSLDVVMKEVNPAPNVPLHDLAFPCLRSSHMGGLDVSETSLYGFIKAQPDLASFTFSNIQIVRGSWSGLFSRIRQLKRQVKVKGEDRASFQ